MGIGLTVAVVQFVWLFLTAAGWAMLVERFCSGRLLTTKGDYVMCLIAGWSLALLLLQNLVYLDLQLNWTSWLAALGATGGWVQSFGKRQRKKWTPRLKGVAIPTLIMFAVALFQGAALWKHGAFNYYGSAHNDQVNYVMLSQFLVESPFSTSLDQVDLNPWLVKGIDTKDMRICQSIALGYLGVTSFTDAQVAYGALTIFSISLLAASVYGLISLFGPSRMISFLGACWAGCLPIVTHVHLDGFLSQTFTLCALPSIFYCGAISNRHPRLSFVCSIIILAMLLNAYTEIFILGVALHLGAHLGIPDRGLLRRITEPVMVTVLAMMVVPTYTFRAFHFASRQYDVASNPEALANLVPRSGTWGGWAELFLQRTSFDLPVPQLYLLYGFAIFVFLGIGITSSQQIRRTALFLMSAVPTGVLCILLSSPEFSKYPFAKLLGSFSPIFVFLVVLGISRTPHLIQSLIINRKNLTGRKRAVALRVPAILGVSVGLAISLNGSWPLFGSVLRNEGILSVVNSTDSRRIFRELANSSGDTFLINEPHPILNAWLAYHGRNNSMYTNVDILGDRPTPSSLFAFRANPPTGVSVSIVNHSGIKSPDYHQFLPDLTILNPQGMEGTQQLTFYWIGDSAEIRLREFGDTPRTITLSMRALAGLANPSPNRTVTLVPTNPSGEEQTRHFSSDAKLTFQLLLQPGRNTFRFQVDSPTEWVVKVPGDGRKHMVRIQELDVSSAEIADGQN